MGATREADPHALASRIFSIFSRNPMARFSAVAGVAALALSFAWPSFAQTYRDAGGSVTPGVVPVGGDGSGPLFTSANPGRISGSLSANLSGFQPTPSYSYQSVTTSSAAYALPTGTAVVVYNTGSNPITLKLGSSGVSVVAGQGDIVPAGGWMAFAVGTATAYAAVGNGGSSSVVVSGGSGLAAGAGGGGGSGSVPTGSAGSPNASVLTVQGVAAMTPLNANPTQWGGAPRGAATTWGTAPSGNVPGVNAELFVGGAAVSSGSPVPVFATLATQGPTSPGGSAGVSDLVGGVFTPGGITLTATQQAAVQLQPDGRLIVAPTAGAQGGASSFSEIVPANTTGISVKASAGTLYEVNLANIGASVLWVKLYDSATAPTCGSGTPLRRLMIPANSTAANGAGSNINLGPVGVAFANGIGLCVTAGVADTDTTSPVASVATVGLSYK